MGSSCSSPSDGASSGTGGAIGVVPEALPAAGHVGPLRPPAESLHAQRKHQPALTDSSKKQQGTSQAGHGRILSAAQGLAIAAKANGLEEEEGEVSAPLHSIRSNNGTGSNSSTGSGRKKTSPLLGSIPGAGTLASGKKKKVKKAAEGGGGEEIITTTTVTVTATTTAIKRNPKQAAGADPFSTAPPPSSQRPAITLVTSQPATPSSATPTPKKTTLTLSSKSHSPASGQPSATAAVSPSSATGSVAQEKAELQKLLLEMRTKTDTWMASLESKQTDEALEADLAAASAHREQVGASRAAAEQERQAAMSRALSSMAQERFSEFQTVVESDKQAVNARVDAERQQRRLLRPSVHLASADELLAASDSSPSSSPSSASPAAPTPAPAPAPAPSLSPTLVIDSSSPQHSSLNSYITPFTPQSKAAASPSVAAVSFVSPASQSQSVISLSGVAFSPTATPRARYGAGDLEQSFESPRQLAPRRPSFASPSPNAAAVTAVATPASPAVATATIACTPSKSSITLAPSAKKAFVPIAAEGVPLVRTDLNVLQEELSNSTLADAKVRALEARAAELPAGHQKQVLLSQARLAAQLGEVRRLEEAQAQRKADLLRQQQAKAANFPNAAAITLKTPTVAAN